MRREIAYDSLVSFERTKLSAVAGVDAASIDNSRLLGYLRRDSAREIRSESSMHVLRLLRGCNFASADSPHGLVCDHHIPSKS